MDPKLAILFLLFGTIIGLSRLDEQSLGRVRQQLTKPRWRKIVPSWRKF